MGMVPNMSLRSRYFSHTMKRIFRRTGVPCFRKHGDSQARAKGCGRSVVLTRIMGRHLSVSAEAAILNSQARLTGRAGRKQMQSRRMRCVREGIPSQTVMQSEEGSLRVWASDLRTRCDAKPRSCLTAAVQRIAFAVA